MAVPQINLQSMGSHSVRLGLHASGEIWSSAHFLRRIDLLLVVGLCILLYSHSGFIADGNWPLMPRNWNRLARWRMMNIYPSRPKWLFSFQASFYSFDLHSEIFLFKIFYIGLEPTDRTIANCCNFHAELLHWIQVLQCDKKNFHCYHRIPPASWAAKLANSLYFKLCFRLCITVTLVHSSHCTR